MNVKYRRKKSLLVVEIPFISREGEKEKER
jgi:hypothetical protein